MKRLRPLTWVAVTLTAALLLTIQVAAQEQAQAHYTVQDLGTLGGDVQLGL